MTQISVDEDFKTQVPNLALGVVQASVQVSQHDVMLWNEITTICGQISKKLTLESLYAIPEIQALREAYKTFGKDPVRYRGSAEALARRIIQGKGIYKINTVVDINNLVSLQTMHSVGSYDFGHVTGPVTFRIGQAGESYKGIGKEIINIGGLPVFADQIGPFGSPTSDSERTMITSATRDLMMVIISFAKREALAAQTAQAVELICAYANASKHSIEAYIV